MVLSIVHLALITAYIYVRHQFLTLIMIPGDVLIWLCSDSEVWNAYKEAQSRIEAQMWTSMKQVWKVELEDVGQC